MEGQVYVEGLREFRRDVRRMDKDLGKGITDGLREAARIVADEASRRAPAGTRPIPPGRRPRKRLRDVIRPRVRGDVALVGAFVRAPDGYRYPRRIEYDDQGEAFLRPALAAKSREVEERIAQLLDDIERRWRG